MLKGLKIVRRGKAEAFTPSKRSREAEEQDDFSEIITKEPKRQKQTTSSNISLQVLRDSISNSSPQSAPASSSAPSEAASSNPGAREAWMLEPPADFLGGDKRDNNESEPGPPISKPVVDEAIAERETNPYWKNGGTGLPPEDPNKRIGSDIVEHDRKTSVGDGGAGWRAKALQRAKERAAKEGASVDEVVHQQWGVSAKELQQAASSSSSSRHDSRSDRDRYMRSSKSALQRPDTDSKQEDYSWRRRRDDRKYDEEKRESRRDERREDKREYRRDDRREERSDERRSDRRDERRDERKREERKEERVDDRSSRSERRESRSEREADRERRSGEKNSSSRRRSVSPDDRRPARSASSSEETSKKHSSSATSSRDVKPEDANKNAVQMLKLQLLDDLDDEVEEQPKKSEEVVVLPEFDLRGRRITKDRHDDDIAQNQDRKHLKELVHSTKGLGDEEADKFVVDKIAKNKRYKEQTSTEDQYDNMQEDMFEKKDTKKKKRPQQDEEAKERSRQIKEYQKIKSVTESCFYCFGNSKRFKKHMVIALGDKVMLMLPPTGSFVPGHCLLVPLEHKLAGTGLDEDELQEMDRFKKCLKQMFFEKEQKDVIFTETVTPFNLKKQRHTFIECFPVPLKAAQEAPSYFKKAILEADSEWAQNKKLVDTRGKGVHRSIPKDFPYFSVEFGLQGGFAHVIEDETKFSYNFGKEIIAGIMKLPPTLLKTHTQDVSFEKERKEVLEFLDKFKLYDWTAELDGGSY